MRGQLPERPVAQDCDWCSERAPRLWFGGYDICLPCWEAFLSKNNRRERIQRWLRERPKKIPTYEQVNRWLGIQQRCYENVKAKRRARRTRWPD